MYSERRSVTNIQALIFDFGGTLDANGIHWRDRFFRLIKGEFPDIDWDAFEKADRNSIEQFLAKKPTHLSLRESAREIVNGIAHNLGFSQKIVNPLVSSFCRDAASALKQNREWLITLDDQFQLGVISNNFGNTQGWCDEYGLSPLLDVVVDSTVVGISKPDPRVFQIALSELKVSPEETIYVGDTFLDDIVGAKQAGMFSAWLVGQEEKECPDTSLIDLQLSQLRDLEKFLQTPKES
jgi:putative hydrolase of the HAD superfamily